MAKKSRKEARTLKDRLEKYFDQDETKLLRKRIRGHDDVGDLVLIKQSTERGSTEEDLAEKTLRKSAKDTKDIRGLIYIFSECEGGISKKETAILQEVLGEIKDPQELAGLYKESPANIEKCILERLQKVLRTIYNPDKLAGLYEEFPTNSAIEKCILERLQEVLGEIDDPQKLVVLWEKYKVECILERLQEVLGSINHPAWIIRLLNTLQICQSQEHFLARLDEILEDVDDIGTLYFLWQETLPYLTTVRYTIANRMEEVINGVSLPNIPRWFLDMLAKPDSVPVAAIWSFRRKAKDIYGQLERFCGPF